MNIILYETNAVTQLHPITFMRAACDIRCAGATLLEACAHVFPKAGIDVATRKHLAGKYRDIRKTAVKKTNAVLLLDATLAPDVRALVALSKTIQTQKKSFTLYSGTQLVGAYVAGSDTNGIDAKKAALYCATLNYTKVLQTWDRFTEVWHPITLNRQLLATNLPYFSNGYKKIAKNVFVGKKTVIAQHVVLDSSKGPIVIGSNVRIKPFAYIAGPVHIGDNVTVNEFTAIKGSSIGPWCKVGGEIGASVMQGYSNKQHYGVLAYSWVGEWVNIGGGASTSDLKNTYGAIKVHGKDSGEMFLGCIIADYAKISGNTIMFPGLCIGVSSMAMGIVAKNIPSFTAYLDAHGKNTEFDIQKALLVQARMLPRRNVLVTQEHKKLLHDIFNQTASERKQAGVKKGKIGL